MENLSSSSIPSQPFKVSSEISSQKEVSSSTAAKMRSATGSNLAHLSASFASEKTHVSLTGEASSEDDVIDLDKLIEEEEGVDFDQMMELELTAQSNIPAKNKAENQEGYAPFLEGVEKAEVAKTKGKHKISFRSPLLVKIPKILNFLRIFVRNHILKKSKSEQGGFEPETFTSWEPNRRALGLEGDTRPTPYQLAQALGFSMSKKNVEKELDKVPPRTIENLVFKGEEEGDKEVFREQLGLENPGKVLKGPFGKALSLDAGVSEGYSVGTHSMMVLRMFDQHLLERFHKNNKFEGVVTEGEFRLFLMLHDIGKGLAVQQEGAFETPLRKQKELEYCSQAIEQMIAKGVLSEDVGNIFRALLFDVTIGKFLMGKINEGEAVAELKEAMSKFNLKISPEQFFSLSKLFHIADAGAYKNIRRIGGLFEATETGKMRHAHATGHRRAGPRLGALKKSFVKSKETTTTEESTTSEG